MENVLAFIKAINSFLWGNVIVFVLVGAGLFYTVYLGFPQMFRRAKSKNPKPKEKDEKSISPFQALMTSVAAQVGTGSLAGVATAIVMGGPGAIFWMWVSAFSGMGLIFGEAVLAQIYRKNVNGQFRGGPAYYIKEGLGSPFLAKFFAVAIIFAAVFGTGGMVQSNSLSSAIQNSFGVPLWITGVALAVFTFFIIRGGMHSIAKVCELLVPFMGAFYLLGGFIILVMNASDLPLAFSKIFEGAFTPSAALGGVIGVAVKDAVRAGISRGVFSNEAGLGSTPHAHAVSKVDHPAIQGNLAMIAVFMVTMVVCTLTALVIIISANDTTGTVLKGITLTQHAFVVNFGNFGSIFITIALFFFSFSTIVGWYFFGESNVKFLFQNSDKKIDLIKKIYDTIFVVALFIGAVVGLDLVWELADTANALMIIPNVIALLFLSKVVKKSYDQYRRGEF